MKRMLAVLALFVVACLHADALTNGLPDGLYAEVTIPRGVVVAELHYKQVPMTVANFVGLAEGVLGPKKGVPFFDGLTFHRVVEDFVAQGGDPTGTGDGGPGYSFPDEIVPGLRHDRAGVVQMANDGPDTNGSQWCFMLREVNRLNYLHSVFGHVVRGLEVLPRIQQGDTMRVKILRVGPAAGAFRVTQESFDALKAKAGKYDGPMEPGSTAPFDDPDKILPTDWPRARAFNFKLANFERVTGRRLCARVLAKTPEETGGFSRYLRGVSSRLGTDENGILAIYCADKDEWHLWLGENDLKVLGGDKLDVEGASKSAFMREVKAAFLAEAKAHTEAAIAYALKHLPEGKTLSDAQKIKLSVDSVLDGLIFKYESRAK